MKGQRRVRDIYKISVPQLIRMGNNCDGGLGEELSLEGDQGLNQEIPSRKLKFKPRYKNLALSVYSIFREKKRSRSSRYHCPGCFSLWLLSFAHGALRRQQRREKSRVRVLSGHWSHSSGGMTAVSSREQSWLLEHLTLILLT